MGKPWAELSSAERKDAILLAVANLRWGEGTAANIAHEVDRVHALPPMEWVRSRVPSPATRVTSGIMALRREGLLTWATRRDGLSGSADALTPAGQDRVHELRSR